MSIESLKQQARKHEQNEDWKKALDQYNKALAELAREEQVDIGLYNRVGDLYVRVGGLDKAVEHYDKAVALYREAYLPNNAIAVCKKIIRNVPDRHTPYLVMGQIRAEQGFLPDARTQFLTYAERMQQAGDMDESFRALVEFCDLAPDDVGVRITVAEQMAAKGRTEDAVQQLLKAHRHYTEAGDSDAAAGLEAKIHELDPEADVNALPAMGGGFAGSSVGSDGEVMADFGEISLGGDGFGAGAFTSHHAEVDESPAAEAMEEAAGAVEADEMEVEVDAGLAGFDIATPSADADEPDEEEVTELPMMGFDGDDGEDVSFELPTFDSDDSVAAAPVADGDDEAEDDAFELPTMDFGDDEGESVELPTMDFDAVGDGAAATVDEGLSEASSALEDAAEEAFVTPSFDADDLPPVEAETPAAEPTSFDPAPTLDVEPTPEPKSPPAAPTPPAPAPPVAAEAAPPAPPAAPEKPADSGYVDLGQMILGNTEEKSTRFTVAYEEPSGDEEADFAKMLSQFKDKVSENLDSSDVRAHYDLGTAYKEMGLLDEAISSFQAALRASADHLPTYEMMGQTFIEMGQPEAAVRSLERAVESADTVEDELVGIYYFLGRAYEALENRPSAVEYYDRVFSLDINFADVTERLRELR